MAGSETEKKKIARATAGGLWQGAKQSKKTREGYSGGSVAGSETEKKNREGYRGGSVAGSETEKKIARATAGGPWRGAKQKKKKIARATAGGLWQGAKQKKSRGLPRGVCGRERNRKNNREGYRGGSVAGSETEKKIARATAGGPWRGAKQSKKNREGYRGGSVAGSETIKKNREGYRVAGSETEKKIAKATAGGLWRGAKKEIARATAGGLWRGGAGATAGSAARKQQQCNLCCEMSLPDLPGTAVSISEESDVELHENCLQSGFGDDADINSGKAACDGKRVRHELKACISDASGFDDEAIGTPQNRAEVLRNRRNDAQLHAASLRGDSVTKDLEEAGPKVYWVLANMFFVSWWLLGIRKTEAFQWHHHLVKVAESKIDRRCPSTLKRNLHNAVWMSQYSILPLWFLVSDLDFIILA